MKPWMWAALGSTVAALGVWALASRMLDQQFASGGARLRHDLTAGGANLQAQLEQGRQDLILEVQRQVTAQVPIMTERAVRQTLTQYGITPESAQGLVRVTTALDMALQRLPALLS